MTSDEPGAADDDIARPGTRNQAPRRVCYLSTHFATFIARSGAGLIGVDGFPLRPDCSQSGVTHQQVPEHGAEALGVRCSALRVEGRDHDAGVGDLGSVPTVASNDSEDCSSHLLRILESSDQIDRDVGLLVPTTD